MKKRSMIQVLFIMTFVGVLIQGVNSKSLSYLPNSLTLENVIFLLLPAIFYSDLDLIFSKNLESMDKYEKIIATVFAFSLISIYIPYVIKLIILLNQMI